MKRCLTELNKKPSNIIQKKLKKPTLKEDVDPEINLPFFKKPEEPVHEDSVPCLICNSDTSTSREVWLQCNMCLLWAQQDCTSYKGVGFYVCDFCVSN